MQMPDPAGRRGFTILELLVAISVLAVLIAIVVPAVQSARGAAQAVSCRNNFRQVGLALQQYVSTHRRFPRTWGTSRSSFVSILPWLDQADMYASLTGPSAAVNRASIRQPSVLICSVDSVASSRRTATSIGENIGICVTRKSEKSRGNEHDGVFLRANDPGTSTPASISDGMSNTACYAEILNFPRPDASRRIYTHMEDRAECMEVKSIAERCRAGKVGLAVWMIPRGSDWVHGIVQVNQYMHVLPPNERDCLFTPGAASEHRGGAHTALCDGSVRFVSSMVDERVWQAVGSRNGLDGPVEW